MISIFGIVPSVAFVVYIPSSRALSREALCYTKDKVTRPSSALRHSCKLKMIHDKEAPGKSILVTISDGGSDQSHLSFSLLLYLDL